MMLLYLGVCVTLFAAVLAAPQDNVRGMMDWLSIKPAVNRTLATVSFRPYHESFKSFISTHDKRYESEKEESYRFNIFMKNMLYMEIHNKQYMAGHKSFYLGVNQFADMESWEFAQYNGFLKKSNRSLTGDKCSTFMAPNNMVLPTSVDWREKGYVTPVKDQGQCGSCWSFSTTGALEGQHFHQTGTLLSLSEQQLVDCAGGKYGNQGCNGGLMDEAFKYIRDIGGLELENVYKYHAKDETCHFKKSKVVAKCTGCTDVTTDDESALQQALATVGPVSVAIDAAHPSFQLYKGGVYDEPECSQTQLDHGVLTVGYGTMEGSDYWLVKNSWAETWGDKGYIKMSRNKDNQCGIASMASYPLV